MLRGTTFALLCVCQTACGGASGTSADAGDDGADAATAGWRTQAPVGEGPTQEIGVAALDGFIYVLGGFNQDLVITASLQVYNPIADSWTRAAPVPIAMHHANLIPYDGKLYCLGSMDLDGFGFRARGESFVYDPQLDAWAALSSMPSGSERGAAAIGVVGDRIVLAGGLQNSTALQSVVSYEPASDSWSEAHPDLPEARDHLMGGAYGGRLYAIGGRTSSIGSIVDTNYSYAPGDGEWRVEAPMPTARGGGAAAIVGEEIVVVGGEGNAAASSGVFSQVEAYSPGTDSWRSLQDMQTPRHGMGAAALGQILYVPGGATTQGFGAVDTQEALTIPAP